MWVEVRMGMGLWDRRYGVHACRVMNEDVGYGCGGVGDSGTRDSRMWSSSRFMALGFGQGR